MSTSCSGCSSASTRLVPGRQIGGPRLDLELAAHDVVYAFLVQHARDLVDRIGVQRRNHRLGRHVGEQRDLAPVAVGQRPVGAAQHDVGLDTDLAQLLDRVLRRLGLHLAGGGDEWHQRQMDVADVVAAERDAHLPDRFEERQRFDVADGAADFDDRDVGACDAGADLLLDLVGDVRNDLHRAAEIVAAALLADHRFVDLAGREIVALAHPGVDEALVVAEVEIGLGAVVGDEHLAVLERAHRARIDVDVRIELEEGDLDAARFEDGGERGGGDALSKTGNDASRDEYELGHGDRTRKRRILVETGLVALRGRGSIFVRQARKTDKPRRGHDRVLRQRAPFDEVP